MEKTVKFYQASTSELYGEVQEIPQKETTPFHPRSPYAVAKFMRIGLLSTIGNPMECMPVTASYLIMKSPRRGETFVTRK